MDDSELARLRGVEGDWRCQNDVKGVRYDGKGYWMDGTMSGTCCNSRQVEMDLLAIEKEGQHKWHTCTTSDIPRPSTPFPIHPRRPTKPVNPPHHCGKLKL